MLDFSMARREDLTDEQGAIIDILIPEWFS